MAWSAGSPSRAAVCPRGSPSLIATPRPLGGDDGGGRLTVTAPLGAGAADGLMPRPSILMVCQSKRDAPGGGVQGPFVAGPAG